MHTTLEQCIPEGLAQGSQQYKGQDHILHGGDVHQEIGSLREQSYQDEVVQEWFLEMSGITGAGISEMLGHRHIVGQLCHLGVRKYCP